MAVDVAALYATWPLADRARWVSAPGRQPFAAYRRRVLPLRLRLRLWQLAHRLQLDLAWFDTFQTYWSTILDGRPLLSPEDFHFLRGVYRLRSQNNEVPDTTDPAVHVAAWQQPELLYQLFFQVYLESLYPRLEPAEWLHRRGVSSFCEFGCATAPVTTAYRQFFGSAARATLIDLPTIALHYAAFRFRHDPGVTPLVLREDQRLLPPATPGVDAVVCMTVFEHLLDPVLVAERFYEMLPAGGWLLFDYHKSQGRGLDSRQGLEQREAVLSFLRDRFTFVRGTGEASGLSIARRNP